MNERRGRASEETRPVAGGKTGKAFRATESLGRNGGAVKQEAQLPGAISPREIFLAYRRALTKGIKTAAKAEKKEDIWGPYWDEYKKDEKERWAAMLTLCQMFKWDPQKDLGISYFGGRILGTTNRTEKILIRLVLWLIKEQLDELMKEGRIRIGQRQRR